MATFPSVQEVILVEFLDGGGEAQLLAGGLQLLDEIGGAKSTR
jgi:hypothetical protein